LDHTERQRKASQDKDRERDREREREREERGKEREKEEEKMEEEEEAVGRGKEAVKDVKATKLLDELFRKTKATPCIYWLPLTDAEVRGELVNLEFT
jgi:apoptotic chromatin condensation inducer in the nucleus